MSDTNPYTAIVTAIPLEDEFLENPADAAENAWEVILNVGKEHGISQNNVFLVFGLGPEVKDPKTGESLGFFEVVRGRGLVSHLQQKICTIRSNRKIVRQVATNALLASVSKGFEGIEEPAPFKFVQVGDYARLIS